MNLNYIHLGLNYDDYIQSNNDLRYEFQQHTNFIDDYFSKKIRKLKFKTDGTFNMISISPTEFNIKPSSIVPDKVLEVYLPFDLKRYQNIKNTNNFEYYLELLEKGFKKANSFKNIPLKDLLSILEEFRKNNCKNEWTHKKKKLKKEDLEIELSCDFTTNYFQLWLSITKLSSKEDLLKEVIIRTEVGVSIHEGMFKDIIVSNDDIIITDKTNESRVIINKKDILNKKLSYKLIGDSEMQNMLTYKF